MTTVDGALPETRRQMTAAARWRRATELTSAVFPLIIIAVLILMIGLVWGRSGGSTAAGELRNGLTIGAIYALIAVGYTMVYGIIELINFAHGDIFVLGGFYAIFIAEIHPFGFDINTLASSGGLGFIAALAILLP